MKKALLFFLIACLMGGLSDPMMRKSHANPLDGFRSALPERTGEWTKASDDRLFDGASIFDHINGAGEVYLAYNMKGCFSRRYASDRGGAIVVDIFDMGSSEDAFGVFTHDQDGVTWNVGQGALYRSGWLSFWKGRFFVSIYGEEETPSSREAIGRLAEDVSSQIMQEGKPPELVLQLPVQGLQSRSIRYLHAHVVLNSHYYLSNENILLLGPDTDVAIAEYERKEGRGRLFLITYPDTKKASAALINFRKVYLPEAKAGDAIRLEDGKWAAAKQKGVMVAVVLEADSRAIVEDLMNAVRRHRKTP